MIINRLSALTCQLTKRVSLQRIISRSSTQSAQVKNTKADDDDDDDDDGNKPIEYSLSPAAKWQAKYSQQGGNFDDVPAYQPYIAWISSLTFLVYFVWLREANDIDEIFDRDLSYYFDIKENDIRKKLPPEVVIKKVS